MEQLTLKWIKETDKYHQYKSQEKNIIATVYVAKELTKKQETLAVNVLFNNSEV